MALNKLALCLIAGVASVGVIGGVTAAVVTSNSSTVMNPEDGKPGKTETEIETDFGKNPNQNSPAINLEEIVSKFKAEDIVLSNSAMKNDTYAFNVKKEQLGLSADAMKNVPERVEVVVESINNASNGVELNQGKLSVTLKASLKDKKQGSEVTGEAKTNTVLVDGFKASSDTLRNYLKPTTDQAKTNVLNLTKPVNTEETIVLTSIETLNQVTKTPIAAGGGRLRTNLPKADQTQMIQTSGITSLFRQINKPKDTDSNEKLFL